ncbi:hypothetical protein [Spiroplasma sp. SV19]|uniref:hypothetical protein n=1 Tax=Spiroplasma sp. SV19 TaxID=2570468 RepID=UPI0024B8359D|nr:hypothetical protein [Spiroplasma sp. SV19]
MKLNYLEDEFNNHLEIVCEIMDYELNSTDWNYKLNPRLKFFNKELIEKYNK